MRQVEVWLFVPLPKASEILGGYRELVAAGLSAVADELVRVTRAHAHLLARTATAHDR
jgi:hypothetical protein